MLKNLPTITPDSDGTNVKYLNETDGAYLSKYYGSAGEFGSYSIGRYSVYDDGDSQWEGRYNVFKIENAVLMYSPDSILFYLLLFFLL